LISIIRNWHRYKNIIKIIDFLISYSFQFQQQHQKQQQESDSDFNFNYNLLIHPDLLEEFLTIVRNDFGIVQTSSISGYLSLNMLEARSSSLQNINANSTDRLSPTNQNALATTTNNSLQTSIGWLTSSLSYVVNSTATQLTGAAISAVTMVGNVANMGSTNSTSEYDNIQQFCYDKRLYKEFPFVGFYLSLCEERIEAELSLWSTFRLYLSGTTSQAESLLRLDNESTSHFTSLPHNVNSTQFIEACWKRTLQAINKSHSLCLNFSPNRLMLFKWCERAVDLPIDHPLLVLYWQKFFQIYLDKSSCSANNNNNNDQLQNSSSLIIGHGGLELRDQQQQQQQQQSKYPTSTLKLFTSTSQLNSMLKQMKKQLEMTSEHFAYLCHHSPTASTSDQDDVSPRPSAPSLDYNYLEFMSKLYYAFSLWIDEARLHDPQLYLPALPTHYQPDILARVFYQQSDLWIQYVDLNKLTVRG
jgi:hypothetical protein